jgi:riboflavin kinase/FMN adenylyltransferase
MKVWRGDPLTWGPAPDAGSAIAVGVFDGVHRGHQAVLADVEARAEELQVGRVALTFDVHPLSVVAPTRAPKLLTSVDQRIEVFDALGIDIVGVLPFEMVRTSSPEAFVSKVLVGALNARLVVIGADFRYGKDRAGDAYTLRKDGAGYGFEVDDVELLEESDGAISSTTIRRLVTEGDVVGAAELLGRHFEIRGEVVHGDQRGRAIGIPTANVVPRPEMVIPKHGVFAARVVAEGSVHDAVVNVGVRPTFDGDTVVVEAHLLDYDGDLYGGMISMSLVDRLRDEMRFAGVEALLSQIHADIEAARVILTGMDRG